MSYLWRWLEPEKKPQEKKSPYTTPRVGPETDPKERRRPCIDGVGPQLGENNCHNAYAMSISGVPREFTLTKPPFLTVSYDALGRDQILYEVKTGYGRIFGDERFRIKMTNKFIDQSMIQLKVANLCGYKLVWIFNDKRVQEYFDGNLPVKTQFREFKCNTPSDGI